MSEAIRQAVIDGWIMVSMGVPFLLWLLCGPIREGRKDMRATVADPDRKDVNQKAADVFAMLLLLLLALGACSVSVHGVRHLLNPGYFAGVAS